MASALRQLRSKQRVSYEEFQGEVFEDDRKMKNSSSKKKVVGMGKQLFPIEIVATDFKANKVKVHYVGYPVSMDEWRDCSEDSERIGVLMELPSLNPDTLNERFFCFISKLEREIKLHLFSSKQGDPNVKLEIDVALAS